MGTNVKQVGGGPATGLADQYTSFLKKGIFGNGFGSGGDPAAQTAGGFGNAIDSFINNKGPKTQYGVDTSKLDNSSGGYDFKDFNPQGVDFSKFNTDALSGFKSNVGAFSPQDLSSNPQFQAAIAAMQKNGGGFTPQAPGSVNFDLGKADISPYTALLDRQKTQNVNDLRARFGAGGGTSLGTPASTAEGNYRAAADAENATSLANIGQSQQQLELARQQGAAGINAQNYSTFTNASLGGAQLSSQNLDSVAKYLSNAAELKQTGQLTARGQDVTSEGMRLDAISKATGYNLDQLKAMSQQGIDIGSLQNQNEGLRATNQAANHGIDIDAIAKGLGLQLQGQGMNQQQGQFDRTQQASMIQSLLEQMFGISSKGISQRENIATPSTGANILNAVGGIAQGVGSIVKH